VSIAIRPMAKYLDVTNWSRRDAFEFFRGYDNPYFNVCTRLDISRLMTFLQNKPDVSVSLSYHYFALRIANEIEPFRYRLDQGRVLVHDVIHGGTTVLHEDGSLRFVHFEYENSFEEFQKRAGRSIAHARTEERAAGPRRDDDAVVYFTTLPWISFTSISHARNWGHEDSTPMIAFGRFLAEGARTLLPVSVEVHHALMDGFHVGQYLTRFEEMAENPEVYLIDCEPRTRTSDIYEGD
jgi:chloramphenicol O-acetyltransferase type A